MKSTRARSMAVIAAIAFTTVTAAAQSPHPGTHPADSASAVAAVAQFHDALGKGDAKAASAMLDSRAVVIESGEIETLKEYLDHHLPADIAFASAVKSSRQVHSVALRDDVAWVASTSHSAGTYKGRPIDSDGAELMVLSRTAGGWRITAIHWSSRRRPAK